MQTAIFGGGCFWCTEAIFRRLNGVSSVVPGYAGGQMENPNYDKVSMGTTGHAEVIKVEFYPNVISYERLLAVFFALHDATQVNGQGADIGTQYRSLILTTSEDQLQEAQSRVMQLKKQGEAVVTQVEPLKKFYDAESYHQKYYEQNPTTGYCMVVISPKLDKLREKFPELLKSSQ